MGLRQKRKYYKKSSKKPQRAMSLELTGIDICVLCYIWGIIYGKIFSSKLIKNVSGSA